MSFLFDRQTLLLTLILGNLFTALLIFAYRYRYPQNTIWLMFVAAKGLQTTFWIILFEYKGMLPSGLPSLCGLFYLGGITLEALALLRLLGLYNHRVGAGYAILAVTGLAAWLAADILTGDGRADMALASLLEALVILFPAAALLTRRAGTPLQKWMGSMYAFILMLFLARTVDILLSDQHGRGLPYDNVQLLGFIGTYLMMFLGTAGFMLLSREQAYIELERFATYDELTGILNRRSFALRTRHSIAAAALQDEPYSFLLMDIDHFKQVNDTHGHDTGDKVLMDFTVKIRRELGTDDLFGRFGGEEFAVYLHGAGEQDSDRTAERLRKAAMGTVYDSLPLQYTVSIGVVTVTPGQRVPLDTIFKLSDRALYQAKQSGRNCVVRGQELYT